MCVWLKTAKSTDLCSKRLQNGESKIRKNNWVLERGTQKLLTIEYRKPSIHWFFSSPAALCFHSFSFLSLSPITRIHLLVLIQSSLRLDKFKESSVIHSLGLSTCCAVSRASAKDIFGAVRTKSGFGGNYCTKDASNFHCISIILCIIIIILIIFFHRCFLLSGSGSKLKSHFAFNWYSLTPQKRPNEFDVKTFGPSSLTLPLPLLPSKTTLPAPKNFDVQTVVLPGSSHYLSPLCLSPSLSHNRCDEHKMEQGQCQRENDAQCEKERQRERERRGMRWQVWSGVGRTRSTR